MAYENLRFNTTCIKLPTISNLSKINQISRTGNYLFCSHLHLGLPIDLFPLGVVVKILKELLPSSILAT